MDTGLHPVAAADSARHYRDAPALGLFKFEQNESIADQIDVESVSKIILTHLHFDHAGALSLFPESTPIIVQRAEWDAGQHSQAIARNIFVPKDYAGTDRPVVLIDGDHDLFGDGSIELLPTPGHTPGHQSVRVGDVVIGGDVVLYASSLNDRKFGALIDDPDAQLKSADRLRALREKGLQIQPGHDPEFSKPGPLISQGAARQTFPVQ